MLCKVLKLNTGETILGNITEEARSYIDVHRPMKVSIIPNRSGSLSVALMRWEPISDFENPVRIFKYAIVAVSEPSIEFKDNYAEIYNQYENKEFFEEKAEQPKEDDTSENLTKIEEMLKAMMESNTNHTLH
jgi:hypothetical protein